MPNILLSPATRLMKHPHNFPLPFCPPPRRFVLLLCLLATAATSGLLASENAQAQGGTAPDYVDLVMLYETGPVGDPSDIAYSVQNAGTATAAGVTVSFHLEDLEIEHTSVSPNPPDKKNVTCADGELTCQEFSWKFGSLLPGETSKPFTFETERHSAFDALALEPGWKGAGRSHKRHSFLQFA